MIDHYSLYTALITPARLVLHNIQDDIIYASSVHGFYTRVLFDLFFLNFFLLFCFRSVRKEWASRVIWACVCIRPYKRPWRFLYFFFCLLSYPIIVLTDDVRTRVNPSYSCIDHHQCKSQLCIGTAAAANDDRPVPLIIFNRVYIRCLSVVYIYILIYYHNVTTVQRDST